MNQRAYYQAMLARDHRFDGKFFVGVKTTGIYCRPICPAKPKLENVEFFQTAAAAEKSGYRPCLRCRPESAPLSPAWNGKSSLVQRALRLIASEGYFEANEDEFAEKLGVSARHLRRVFAEEVGMTPKQIAIANRLNFARKLIVETHLPVTEVAMTAGFSSLRRFNDAFKKRFHREPRAVRKKQDKKEPCEGITLTLSYRPPFDWQCLLDYYRTHRIGGVENVTDDAYERVFRAEKSLGFVRVTHDEKSSQVQVQILMEDSSRLFSISQRIRQMFDLDSDPLLITNSFQSNRFLDSLWKKHPGLRIARGWDAFETSVCALLGQVVSVGHARNLVQDLVHEYGERISHPLTSDEAFLFPSAQTLAESDLSKIKATQTKKKAIRELARRVANHELDLNHPQDPKEFRSELLKIPGIGAWTSEYVSLRALGDADAFPGTDLILKRAIEKHPDLDLEVIRPWRSYAAIYLWKHYAQKLTQQKRGRK
jgi:AraC family transcriptional regulator of adaptative response / DNA-3-methyladenine glycosylase II